MTTLTRIVRTAVIEECMRKLDEDERYDDDDDEFNRIPRFSKLSPE